MAFDDKLGRGVIEVSVEDRAVAEKLARIDAEFKAAMAGLDRREATIKIKGDISDLRTTVTEAKLHIKALEEEEKRLGTLRAQQSGADKGWSTRRLKDLAAEKKALEDVAQRLDIQLKSQIALDRAMTQTDQANQVRDRREGLRKQAATDAEVIRQTRHQQYVRDTQQALKLQQQYLAAKERIDKLDKAAAAIPQGAERQRVDLQSQQAKLDMLRLHEELRMIGRDPIKQEVKLDTSAASKAWNLFTRGTHENRPNTYSLDDFGAKLKALGNVKVNLGPFNASIAGVITTLGAGAPVVAALTGAIGSLIAVMGSGIVGAAGLGGAALSGFGLAALGVKAAVHNSLQQLSTFKSALNAYQTAQLQYGPATSATPASARASARIPVAQQRVTLDQQKLSDAIAVYGQNSAQAANASLALASAQNTLSSAQSTAAGGANRTQKALDKLNQTIAQSDPAMARAMKGWQALSGAWQHLTGAVASRDLGKALDETFKTANANVKWFARDTNTALDSISAGWGKWMHALRTPEAKRILDNLFTNFNKSLKPLMDGIGNIAGALGRWFSTMSNFLPGIAQGFDDWTKKVLGASKATDGWSGGAQTLIDSLKSIGHFAAAAGRFLFALFAPGVKPGQGFLDDMTASLNRAAKSMRTLEGQQDLRKFFKDSVKGTEQLWNALKPLGEVFINLAALFAPIAKAMVPILGFFIKMTADATKALGPLGDILLKLAAFLVVGRIIGKLGPMFGVFGNLKNAGSELVRLKDTLIVMATASGGLGTRLRAGVDQWKSSARSAAVTTATAIEDAFKIGGPTAASAIAEALNVGGTAAALKMAEAIRTGAVTLEASEVAGGRVAATEIAGGMAAGGRVAATEIAAGEALGGVGGIGGVGGAKGAAGKGGLSKILSGAGKALGIAGTGIFAAQTVGDLVGGKAGTAVSNIGSGIAGGAALGSFGGLPGTLIGGLVGGMAGAFATFFAHGESYGQSFAKSFTKGFGGAATSDFRKQQADLANQYNRTTAPAATSPGRGRPAPGAAAVPLTAEQKARAEAIAYDQGRGIAAQLAKGWNQYHVQDRGIMTQQLLAEIKSPKLSNAAKASAVGAAVAFAQNLERQGRLAPGSAQRMLTSVEKVFPGIIPYLGRTAKQAAANFTVNLNLKQTVDNTKKAMDAIRNSIPQVAQVMDSTAGDIHVKAAAVVRTLQNLQHSGFKPMREAATRDLERLAAAADTNFASIVKTVSSHSGEAVRVGSTNFRLLAGAIWDNIAGGAGGTETGLKNIEAQLNAMLSAVGGTKLTPTVIAAVTSADLAVNVGSGLVSNIGSPFGHATGGRVPGPVGPDNWTLVDQSGRAQASVGGGELLVANRHTERALDMATMMIYGKTAGELVAGEKRVHSAAPRAYATGGWVSAIASAESLGGTGYMSNPIQGRGYSELGVPPTAANVGTALGRLPYLTHMRIKSGSHEVVAAKQDIGTGSSFNPRLGLYPDTVADLGLSGGQFNVLIERADGQPLTGGGVGATGGTAWKDIKAPRVTSKSAMSEVVKGVFAKAVKAANVYGRAHTPQTVSGGGTFAGGAAPMVGPAAVQAMVAEASAITASHFPYVYGGGHGSFAGPYDCSGAVSAVLHAAGYLSAPEATGALAGFGQAGPGSNVTIYVENSSAGGGHTIMSINGHLFGTSDGIGGEWLPGGSPDSYSPIGHWEAVRHPPGLARGGRARNKGSFGKAPAHFQDEIKRNMGNHFKSQPGMATGGMVDWAGEFAQGGSFTATRPTMAMFGENGPESVFAIPHAATGGRFAKDKSKSKSHPTQKKLPLGDPAMHETKAEQRLDAQVAAALRVYNDYNHRIHHIHPHYTTGTAGHWTGHIGHGLIKSTLKWHPSTVKQRGGASLSEIDRLNNLQRKYQLLLLRDEAADPKNEGKFQSVFDIPPKDRIGGIGTSDIENALSNAQGTYDNFQSGLTSNTDSKGNRVKPTKAQLSQSKQLLGDVNRLKGILGSAQGFIQDFGNIETEIGTLGTYMDTAAASGTDSSWGFDPGMGKTPQLTGHQVKKTWAQWKAIRAYWEHKHTKLLQSASQDIRKHMGKHPDKWGLAYLQTLDTSLSTAQADEQALAGTTDSGVTLDSYIAGIPGDSKKLAVLNYASSVAQSLLKPDDPGTAVREDIVSMGPELSAAKALTDFYSGVWKKAASDPKMKDNYALLTSAADAYNSANQNYQSLLQTVKDSSSTQGPTQLQMFDTARAGILNAYGSNIAPPALGGTGSALASGAAAGVAFNPDANPSARRSADAPVQGSTNVSVVNNYKHTPEDPHSWSQALSWELQAAV